MEEGAERVAERESSVALRLCAWPAFGRHRIPHSAKSHLGRRRSLSCLKRNSEASYPLSHLSLWHVSMYATRKPNSDGLCMGSPLWWHAEKQNALFLCISHCLSRQAERRKAEREKSSSGKKGKLTYAVTFSQYEERKALLPSEAERGTWSLCYLLSSLSMKKAAYGRRHRSLSTLSMWPELKRERSLRGRERKGEAFAGSWLCRRRRMRRETLPNLSSLPSMRGREV